jgi:hypothetical protein
MQPMMPYLLGSTHPLGTRLVDIQKCFRGQDIEEVGDNRHDSFFEMMGNWSLGDYFKKEQINWYFEFLTKNLGLPKEKLYVSVFGGDDGFDEDTEAIEIWKTLGLSDNHIYGGWRYWCRWNCWSRLSLCSCISHSRCLNTFIYAHLSFKILNLHIHPPHCRPQKKNDHTKKKLNNGIIFNVHIYFLNIKQRPPFLHIENRHVNDKVKKTLKQCKFE